MLMEDAVPAGVLSVDMTKKNQVAMFANPYKEGKEEALIINESGKLTYLQHASDSATGWTQAEISAFPPPPVQSYPLTEVVAFVYTPLQEVWAACVDTEKELHVLKLDKDQGWTVQTAYEIPGWWSQLSVWYDSGRPAEVRVFAVEPSTNTVRWLYLNFDLSGNSAALERTLRSPLPSKPDEFAAYYDRGSGNTGVFARTGNQIVLTVYDWTGVQLASVVVATDAQALIGTWNPLDSATGFIYLASNDDLKLGQQIPSLSAWAFQTLSGLGLSTASLWRDADDRLHVYGIQTTTDGGIKSNTLVVLHQTGYKREPSAGPPCAWPIWATATATDGTTTYAVVGLHADVAQFVVDSFPDPYPSQFIQFDGAPATDTFCIATQDVTTDWWLEENIRLPSTGDPYIVTRYVCETTLLDFYGGPLPNYDCVVSANSTTELMVNGVSYLVGPGRSVALKTDFLGKLTFSVHADGLMTPVLTVNAPGLETGAIVRPAASVQAYLAGEATIPSQDGIFNAQALKDAKVDDRPLIDEKIMPADQIVSWCNTGFAIAAGKPPPPQIIEGYDEPQQIAGFVLQTWNSTQPAYRQFLKESDLYDHLQSLHSHPMYGGTWADFKDWLSDVAHGIKEGAIQIAGVALNAAKGLVSITAYIGGKAVDLVSFVITSVREAAQFVEALFAQVANEVSRVVDWLKALFNMSHIWHTKKALESGLNQLPAFATSVLDSIGTVAQGWFEQQETKVRAAFSTLKATYAGGAALVDAQNQAGGGIPTQSGDRLTATDIMGNTQGNWLLSRVVGSGALAAFKSSTTWTPKQSSLWDDFVNAWNQSGAAQEFVTAADKFWDLLTGLVDFDNPKPLGQRELATLFDFIQSMITALLKTCDAVVQAALALIRGAISALNDLFSTPLDIPGLKSIYLWIAKQAGDATPSEFTLGSLLSLVAAFPLTVGYKLINGVANEPFPEGKILPKPPRTQLAALAARGAREGGPIVWWNLWATLQGIGFVAFCAFDIMGDWPIPPPGAAKLVCVGEAVLVILTAPAWTVDNDGNIKPVFDITKVDLLSQWINWFCALTICVIDSILTVGTSKLLRNQEAFDRVGCKINTALGCLSYFGYGVEMYNNPSESRGYKAGSGMILLSPTFQFLRMRPEAVPFGEIAYFVKMTVINIVGDAFGGIVRAVGLKVTTYAIQIIDGDGQSAPINTEFQQQFTVKVIDPDGGRAVSGIPITFTAPTSDDPFSASGAFEANGRNSYSATVETDSNGQAIAPAFTANAYAGSYRVTAAIDPAAGVAGGAVFNVTNAAAAPRYMEIEPTLHA
jgi:hypothetical protein